MRCQTQMSGGAGEEHINNRNNKRAWTTREVRQLIVGVQKCPCIWYFHGADYKNRWKRRVAWHNIGHKLQRTDCKARWKNLKTTFQNIRKTMRTKSTDHRRPSTTWTFWNDISFITMQCNFAAFSTRAMRTELNDKYNKYFSIILKLKMHINPSIVIDYFRWSK